MSGYYENEAATAEVFRRHDDGLVWLHTGDVVTLTEDNTIVFRSRYKRMVKINGINVLLIYDKRDSGRRNEWVLPAT